MGLKTQQDVQGGPLPIAQNRTQVCVCGVVHKNIGEVKLSISAELPESFVTIASHIIFFVERGADIAAAVAFNSWNAALDDEVAGSDGEMKVGKGMGQISVDAANAPVGVQMVLVKDSLSIAELIETSRRSRPARSPSGDGETDQISWLQQRFLKHEKTNKPTEKNDGTKKITKLSRSSAEVLSFTLCMFFSNPHALIHTHQKSFLSNRQGITLYSVQGCPS